MSRAESADTIVIRLEPGVDVIKVKGAEGFAFSLRGALKFYFMTALDDVKAGPPRERLRRYQERSRTALVAEVIRERPRDPGDVLIEAFGGDELRADFRMRGELALTDWIDRVLAAEPN